MNYLFEITNENSPFAGERFFVQCDSITEAVKTIKTKTLYNINEISYIDEYTDDEAEWMGYDTF